MNNQSRVIGKDGLLDELLIGVIQGVLLDAQLDGDLPIARRADELDVVGIDDGRLGGTAQLRVWKPQTGKTPRSRGDHANSWAIGYVDLSGATPVSRNG